MDTHVCLRLVLSIFPLSLGSGSYEEALDYPSLRELGSTGLMTTYSNQL
jgi:hypothetical protein